MRLSRLLVPMLLTVGLALGLLPAKTQADQPAVLRIGLVNSIFRDVPNALWPFLIQPFAGLLKTQSGLKGEANVPGDAHELGQQLDEGKLHIGVFHGFEFGWAQEKYPELKPLLTVVNRHNNLRANLIVRDDSTVKGFADLQGKTLALPKRTREHCHLFLQKFLLETRKDAKDYFGKVMVHPGMEEALDDLVRGKVDAVLIDTISLEVYGQVKSGCFERLKTVAQSSKFPEAVVAYRNGGMDEETLKTFTKAIMAAKDLPQGRDLMTLWQITGFEQASPEFTQTVANIIREYPPAPTSPFRTVSKTKMKS